ncbi:MAG: fimbrillin family protein [Bacteroidales bacterium]|nr:fimbrillin family protein [Bacteroidales bacterium]
MKKLMILAVAAIALVACSKTFDTGNASEGRAISLGTWTGTMTKAPLTTFAVNDIFDVFGYKWKGTVGSQTNPEDVFDGTDVKQTSSGVWEYAGINSQKMKYWDASYAGYTFFAVFPAGQLAAEAGGADYTQAGDFTTNQQTYDGSNEKILVAKKNTVENGSFGNTVQLHFNHTASLVDFQFKKHSDLTNTAVSVTAFGLSNIRTTGTYTVASYDGSNNPVGATVDGVVGLGWTPDGTPTVNATPAAGVYALASAATSAAAATANVDLLTNLVLMPQKFATGAGAQSLHIEYTITDENSQVNTYTADVELGAFDTVNNTSNEDAKVPAWLPGVHYTYLITINAKAIVFTAQIDDWTTNSAFYYLAN